MPRCTWGPDRAADGCRGVGCERWRRLRRQFFHQPWDICIAECMQFRSECTEDATLSVVPRKIFQTEQTKYKQCFSFSCSHVCVLLIRSQRLQSCLILKYGTKNYIMLILQHVTARCLVSVGCESVCVSVCLWDEQTANFIFPEAGRIKSRDGVAAVSSSISCLESKVRLDDLLWTRQRREMKTGDGEPVRRLRMAGERKHQKTGVARCLL